MREIRSYGSVRGVPGNRHPYRDSANSDDRLCPVVGYALLTHPTPVPFFVPVKSGAYGAILKAYAAFDVSDRAGDQP